MPDLFSSVFSSIGVCAVIYAVIRWKERSDIQKAYFSGYDAGRQGQAEGQINNQAFYVNADKLQVYRKRTDGHFCNGYQDALQKKLPTPP